MFKQGEIVKSKQRTEGAQMFLMVLFDEKRVTKLIHTELFKTKYTVM